MRENKEMAINRIVKGLKCSKEEAEKIYAYDIAVEHDEPTEYDLPPDKMRIAQKMSHTGTRKAPTTYKFTQRQRKPNATKSGIIAELAEFLVEKSDFCVENLTILNKERLISFEIGEEKYELTLVQKRKPKK